MSGFGLADSGLLVGRQEVKVPAEYMQMVAALADTSSIIDLGLQCTRCKQYLTGLNAKADTMWKMECACRTFIGVNPLRSR